MSDDKQGASVSEGQASPPAGEREQAIQRALCALSAFRNYYRDPGNGPFDGDAGDWAYAEAARVVDALSPAGGSVGPERADVAVLPEAVSGAEVERLRAIEAAASRLLSVIDNPFRQRVVDHRRSMTNARDALRAALSEGEA